MKRTFAIVCVTFALLIGAKPIDQFPQAEISNGLIRARFYLPDEKEGYYRGSRFDWSGVMPELNYQGHSYFGLWFEKYSPTLHDAIMGPVNDFLPVGYDSAKVGENFLKIGIGIVSKPEEPRYSIVTPYPIVNGGNWAVKKKADAVEFTHTLNDELYSYEYKKTVQLVKGKPQMVLSHTLRNTGKKTIETDVYNHNFFVMDKQPVGPGFTVKFPFTLVKEGQVTGDGDLGTLQDNKILFFKDLVNNQHLYYGSLKGFSNSSKDYDIRVESEKAGTGVRITSNQPLSRLVFWSAPATLCPEPYTRIKVEPGKEFSWKIFYEFYGSVKQLK